jgi:hypothetical protein
MKATYMSNARVPSPGFSERRFASADLSLDKERC